MKFVQIDDFDVESVSIELHPEIVFIKMTEALMSFIPNKAVPIFTDDVFWFTLDSKSVGIYACEFSLSNQSENSCLAELLNNNEERAIAFWIRLYNNGNPHNSCASLNRICVLGFKNIESKLARMFAACKAEDFVKSIGQDINEFFTGRKTVADILANALPSGTRFIKRDHNVIDSRIDYKDEVAIIKYYSGRFSATIPHRYTETERAYGAVFDDYTVVRSIKTPDEANNFNIDALLEDLYANRYGKLKWIGSLGS